jgi:hypothetical protein
MAIVNEIQKLLQNEPKQLPKSNHISNGEFHRIRYWIQNEAVLHKIYWKQFFRFTISLHLYALPRHSNLPHVSLGFL